ncbi:MAG: response regulator, partial [Gammaproteobacteria bacterium]|nr:response regulator [Gammaproteobacteria bacterium]
PSIVSAVNDAISSFQNWSKTNFGDESQLEQLIKTLSDVESESIEKEFSIAHQLSTPTLDISKRLHQNAEIPSKKTINNIRNSLAALKHAVTNADKVNSNPEVFAKVAERITGISQCDYLGYSSQVNSSESSLQKTNEEQGLPFQTNHKLFSTEAAQHIEASKEHLTNWKNSDFENNEPFNRLHDSVSDITEISRKHNFASATELGTQVSNVLERISDESVKPYQETTDKVDHAINEFERSVSSVQKEKGNPEITDDVIKMVEAVASSTSIGETPVINNEVIPPIRVESSSGRVEKSSDPAIQSSINTKKQNSVLAAEIAEKINIANQASTSNKNQSSISGAPYDSSIQVKVTTETSEQPEPKNIAKSSYISELAREQSNAIGRSLDSSLMAHELFSESHRNSGAFDSSEKKAAESHIDAINEQVAEAKANNNASATTSKDGLKSNDPQSLDETILDIFLDEAHDIIQSNYDNLEEWNRDYTNLSAIQDIQRGLHTLKGSARMAELTVLGDLSHYIEFLLESLIEGNIDDKARAHNLLFDGNDLSSEMVRLAEAGQIVYESPDYIETLDAFLKKETNKTLGYVKPTQEAKTVTPSKQNNQPKNQSSYTLRVSSELMERLSNLVGEDSITRARLERKSLEHSFQLEELSRTIIRVNEQIRRLESETEAQILFRHDSSDDINDDFDPLELDRFSEIQQLSRLIAESMDDLQSLRSSLVESIDENKQIITDQASIQRELQDKILSASMIRFDSLRPRVEALVKQAAKELNKEVSVSIYGCDVEVDRKMMEDVITGIEHVIRNAIAHGLEDPEERKAAGKPPIGRIRIGVRREGSELWFVIADDGKGANLDAIRNKARRLGMLNEELANNKDYLLKLLFEPGFSTNDKADQISGRGIGLDVLKELTKERNGSIEIETEPNKGLAISVRIPFTKTITDALSVTIGRYNYAVPLMSIEGIARIPSDIYKLFSDGEITHYSYGQYDYKIESLIDFIDPQAEKTQSPYGVPALLARIGNQRIAFEVGEINNRQEIIIKPVNRQFTSLPGVVGATILNSGLPVPVIEITSLGREFLSFRDRGLNVIDLLESSHSQSQQPQQQDKTRVLVVDDSVTMRKISSKILTKYDCEVGTAKDGLDAIDVISNWVPDLILLDIEMPRMDGFEFAIHVRNSSSLKDIPIIMITSRTGDKHRERAESIGVNDYLGKPYTEEVLMNAIGSVLNMEFIK